MEIPEVYKKNVSIEDKNRKVNIGRLITGELIAILEQKGKKSKDQVFKTMESMSYAKVSLNHMVPNERDPTISRDAFTYNDKIHFF